MDIQIKNEKLKPRHIIMGGTAKRVFELFTGIKSQKSLKLYDKLGYQAIRQEQQTEKVELVYLQKQNPAK